jgi:hypothetical protein
MSGEQSSDKTDEQRKKMEEALNKFLSDIGIPQENPNTDLAKSYISISKDEMSLLNQSDCYERAFILNQHALFIQRQLNRETGRFKWADNLLSKMAVSYYNQNNGNKYATFDEKKISVANNDEVASKLQNIRNYSQLRMSELEFVSSSIKNMADTLKELGRMKGVKNG